MGSFGYAPLWVSDLPALASPKVIQAPSLASCRSSCPSRQEELWQESETSGRPMKLSTRPECAGALVGPPWAKRENGFVFSETVKGGVSLYYEPHCDYDAESLRGIDSVDIVITPGVNQELLSFPLVSCSPHCSEADALHCFKMPLPDLQKGRFTRPSVTRQDCKRSTCWLLMWQCKRRCGSRMLCMMCR